MAAAVEAGYTRAAGERPYNALAGASATRGIAVPGIRTGTCLRALQPQDQRRS